MSLMLLLAGCGTRPDAGILEVSQQVASDATPMRSWWRQHAKPDTRPGTLFGRERSTGLNFAGSDRVRPRRMKPARSSGHQCLRKSGDGLHRQGNAAAERRCVPRGPECRTRQAPQGKREVFVFIHGYNARFPEALYRMVQLKHDSGLPHVAVLFTWASGGNVTDYLYDSNSATIARDGLEGPCAWSPDRMRRRSMCWPIRWATGF
ncbi:MAG: alpha/beta hydrolase [Alphaproteobacteria bacterium]|nr:alpha/beta hydrolase [Alphaproteobacteria bacterium]